MHYWASLGKENTQMWGKMSCQKPKEESKRKLHSITSAIT